jgi:hypothetical protein
MGADVGEPGEREIEQEAAGRFNKQDGRRLFVGSANPAPSWYDLSKSAGNGHGLQIDLFGAAHR